uniref:Uncharacterized protein n=1 Tax=Oryza barthii TaxID=65489 RepID=A0A0D3EN65_9ORYZ
MDHFDLLALSGNNETLAKFAAFVVVQALVYLILSRSSAVFFSGAGAGTASAAAGRGEVGERPPPHGRAARRRDDTTTVR